MMPEQEAAVRSCCETIVAQWTKLRDTAPPSKANEVDSLLLELIFISMKSLVERFNFQLSNASSTIVTQNAALEQAHETLKRYDMRTRNCETALMKIARHHVRIQPDLVRDLAVGALGHEPPEVDA